MALALIRPHPLTDRGQYEIKTLEGLTLAEIVGIEFPDGRMHPLLLLVTERGDIIPRERWRLIRPKAGMRFTVALRLHGGGGGGKGILGTIAMIAVIAFAPVLSGIIAPGWAGTLAGSLLTAGIGLAGALAVSALFKPPSISAGGMSTNPSDSPTYTITGQSNQSTPYGAMLRVYGRHRIFPRLAAVPYVASEGPHQYLHMLLDCGYGPLDIAELKIGDTPVWQYRDVQHRVHPSWQAGDALELYRNDVTYETFGITLATGQNVVRTSSAEAGYLVLEFQCPRGLVRFDAQGNRSGKSVAFAIEVSPVGANTWAAAERNYPFTPSMPIASTTTNVGSVSFIAENFETQRIIGGDGEFYEASIGFFPGGQSTFIVDWTAIGAPLAVGDEVYVANYFHIAVTGSTALSSTQQRITGSGPLPYRRDGNYLSVYAFRHFGEITVNGASPAPIYFAMGFDVPAGQWDVRVRRISAEDATDRDFSQLVWTALRSVADRPPIATRAPHTIIELKIRASEQLSGVVQNVNCIATSILPVWDGSAWTEQATRNAAWAYADVLRGAASTRPLPDARVDLDRLLAWANYCDASVANGVTGEPEPRVYFDHVVDYQTTTYALLQSIASTGRATPTIRDGRHSVIVDEEQTIPVQMFTPRNSWGFSAKRSYLSEPHAVRVKFIDDASWLDGEVTVYTDGYDASTATIFEELKLFGVTRYTQATRDGRYLRAQALLRREEFEIQVDFENLIALRGDLVLVQHDVLRVGGESSRIVAVAGSDITLADPFGTLDPAVSYGVRIRLADGTMTAPISGTPLSPATFTLASVPTPTPAVGDLVSWGFLGVETGEYLVKAIAPGREFTATLTLVELARAIYSADLGTIPPYGPPAGGRPTPLAPPAPMNIRATQRNKTVNREPYADVELAWDPPARVSFARYSVCRVEADGTRTQVADTIQPRAMVRTDVRILEPGATATVRYVVQGVDMIGKQSLFSAPLEVALRDPYYVPGDVAYLSSNVHDKTTTLTWAPPVDPAVPGNEQVRYFELRWTPAGATPMWSAASRVIDLVPWNISAVTVPSRNGTYLVKAVTASRIESANAATTVTAVESLITQDIYQTFAFEPAWDGLKDDTEVHGSGGLSLALDAVAGTYPARGWYYNFARMLFPEVVHCRISGTHIASAINVAQLIADWEPIAIAEPLAGARRGRDWNSTLMVAAMDDPFLIEDWVPLASADPLDPVPPTASDWRPLLHGEYIGRDFHFGLLLESTLPTVTPLITEARVDVDFPERIEVHGDVAVPSGGLDFLFTQPFMFRPTIAIDLQSAALGDYVERTLATRSGVHITVRNASGTGKNGTVDVSAFGVGRTFG